jgi:hypothetical protein
VGTREFGRQAAPDTFWPYHLNWHAPVHISSENPNWVMPWYFNFANDRGLALHLYSLPGRPASHGCVRMLAMDAKWLYRWGDGWTLAAGTRQLIQPGTLILVTAALASAEVVEPRRIPALAAV